MRRQAYFIFFLSGFAGLVYQVLQMRQVGFLLGNTSQATATTLTAYFLGLSVGSWFWGRKASSSKSPIKLFAILEAGIGCTALLYFLSYKVFLSVYPPIYQSVDSEAVLLVIKLLLALALVFPPAFFMGGTLPVIGEAVVERGKDFGKGSALLYGLNVLGATLGSFASVFILIPSFGFYGTCAINIALSLGIAFFCFWLSKKDTGERKLRPQEENDASSNEREGCLEAQKFDPVQLICFLSGFGILALEVIWVRFFAQVHENSVYSYALVMVVVLLALALGSLISSWLAKRCKNPKRVLRLLMMLSGVLVMLCPWLMMKATGDFTSISVLGTPSEYMGKLFFQVLVSIGLVSVVLGTIFPFLMKVRESSSVSVGGTLGNLAALNTLGCIVGAMLCGFVLLEWLGMWRSIQVIASLYFLFSLFIKHEKGEQQVYQGIVVVVAITLTFTQFSPTKYPLISTGNKAEAWQVLEVWEGSGATVSVSGSPQGHRSITVNSSYSLGSTATLLEQVTQGRMPMEIFPDTKSIFFLGMGTGITSGSILKDEYGLEKVVVTELSKEVVEASEKYMTNIQERDFTFGLFKDERVDVLVEDGRHHLMATDEKYDMINADLFLPYRSGAGSLYSYEHFSASKERLSPGGVYVQWLPLFQLTDNEFGIIVKTMSEVFPQLTLWRSVVNPHRELVAVIGHLDKTPLPAPNRDGRADRARVIEGARAEDIVYFQIKPSKESLLFFYIGNLTLALDLFKDYSINSDDRPLIEYMSPLSLRQWEENGMLPSLMGMKVINLYEKVMRETSSVDDPMLMNWSESDRRLPKAGMAFHKAFVQAFMQDSEGSRENWDKFVKEWRGD
jgi:spermidine synthase